MRGTWQEDAATWVKLVDQRPVEDEMPKEGERKGGRDGAAGTVDDVDGHAHSLARDLPPSDWHCRLGRESKNLKFNMPGPLQSGSESEAGSAEEVLVEDPDMADEELQRRLDAARRPEWLRQGPAADGSRQEQHQGGRADTAS